MDCISSGIENDPKTQSLNAFLPMDVIFPLKVIDDNFEQPSNKPSGIAVTDFGNLIEVNPSQYLNVFLPIDVISPLKVTEDNFEQ